jgi:hypothetical protein
VTLFALYLLPQQKEKVAKKRKKKNNLYFVSTVPQNSLRVNEKKV